MASREKIAFMDRYEVEAYADSLVSVVERFTAENPDASQEVSDGQAQQLRETAER